MSSTPEKIAEAAPKAGPEVPLIVDMDGTLLRTDLLMEGIAAIAFSKPLSFARAAGSLLKGRQAFKHEVARIAQLDYASLPVREDFLAHLQEEKKRGRRIELVSAADEGEVRAVAEQTGVFDASYGSGAGRNLKGKEKAQFLKELHTGGFDYAGDSRADLAVWRAAQQIWLVGASESTARAARGLGPPVVREFSNPPWPFRAWIKALRVHQWAKNLLIFAPLFLSGMFVDPAAFIACIVGFFLMGVAASATYIINDLTDLASDRRHRTKRSRPFASGAISVQDGLVTAPTLLLAALACGFALSVPFALALLGYVILTLSYTLRFKKTPLFDVFLLGSLYTIRLIIGAAIIAVPQSPWLLTFAMFFFFSLSLAKRHVEVAHAAPGGKISGRGYETGDAPLTLALGVSSAVGAILILIIYLMEEAFSSVLYQLPVLLWAAPILIGLWTMRIWLLAHRGTLDDDPVAFAVRDRVSIGLGVLLAMSFLAAVFL